MKRQGSTILFAAILLLAFTACKDSDYNKVAKGLDAAILAVDALQTTVIEAQKTGIISTENTRAIVEACVTIAKADKQAITLVRQLAKLGPADKVTIFQIIHPVLKTIDDAVIMDLAGIKDPALRDRIRLALGSIQTTMRTIEAILAGGA